MNFRNILAIAASAAVACAEDIYLIAKSNNTEISNKGVGFIHEGAGINYGFLGAEGQGATLSYNETEKQIILDTGVLQFFRVSGGYVAMSVVGPDSEITFDSNDYLLVNGSSEHFFGCKNTNDPYQYSVQSYEVMYYPENAPSGCLPLTLQKQAAPSSSSSSSSPSPSSSDAQSSSSAPTTTPDTTSSTLSTSATSSGHHEVSSASTFTGAAAPQYAPVGSFFALAGLAAALV
ncbi:hypothetical protein PMKS-001923 [Pichia membranifaciens]|uniref:Cell wall protein n=1 Tax=Pichia membranifaciens TaxID=4926 RepID=A0A1Q2YFX7_9ASCO|nr:hypothetical protein PMKS-001923 [Pichia membranifaciens]